MNELYEEIFIIIDEWKVDNEIDRIFYENYV
jgi:hypothetical protein